MGFTFLAVSCITLSVPKGYTAILLALFFLLIPLHYFTARRYTKHLIFIGATTLVAICYTEIYCQSYQSKIDEIPRDKQIYNGYITAINSDNNPSPYTFQLVDTNNNNKETYSVKFFNNDEFDVGDTITIEGKFSPFKASYYTFSSYFRDIKGNISPSKISKSDIKIKSYQYITLNIKQELLRKAKKLYSDDTLPLVASMGYSDKSEITQGHTLQFATAGISHTLVVSGFHVAIIMAFTNAVLFYIPISKKIKNLILAAALFLFMSIIGFSPSIIRAGAIGIIVLVATNIKKETDALTNLGLIAFVTTISSPYAARDIGLLLSYSACVGLVASEYISKKKNLSGFNSNILATTMAVVFTLPVLSFAGMKMTLLSPIFNLIFLPFISIICGLSFFTPIIAYFVIVGKIINFFLVPINTFVINFMLIALEMISEFFSFAMINLGQENIFIISISLAVGLAVGFIQFKNVKVIKVFAIGIALTSILCYNFLNSNVVEITAFDSGRETSFLVSYKNETSLILSEFMTAKKATSKLSNTNKTRYDEVFLCTKDKINTDSLEKITDKITDMSSQTQSQNGHMLIKSEIDKNQNKFTLYIGDKTIAFGHKKVNLELHENVDLYFLGNDKPKSIVASNVFIFGNTPKWMNVEDIQELSAELTIKINLKTGEYKIVKDVYNFGY